MVLHQPKNQKPPCKKVNTFRQIKYQNVAENLFHNFII